MKKWELGCQRLSQMFKRNESINDPFQCCRRARPHAGEGFAEHGQFAHQLPGCFWAKLGLIGTRIAGDRHELVRLWKQAEASLIQPEANQDFEMLPPACAFETLVGS